MNIAEKKKESNIAEYIVHMYQTEDLIRAYNFNLDDIREYVIQHIPGDEVEKEALAVWYQDVMKEMKQDGIEKSGHLNSVQVIVDELSEIYEDLQSTDTAFEEVHKNSKKHIDKNMELAQGKVINEVQICLNGVYGLLLLRMNGKKVSDDLMESINSFGDVLSYLSFKYRQRHYLSEN